jgi:hypothetical protein
MTRGIIQPEVKLGRDLSDLSDAFANADNAMNSQSTEKNSLGSALVPDDLKDIVNSPEYLVWKLAKKAEVRLKF